MITPISMTDFLYDTKNPIIVMSAKSTAIIRVFQQVSKGFNKFVNDPEFQYALLVKLKGKSFTGDIFKCSPRKYLRLDRDMTWNFKFIARYDFSNQITNFIDKKNASMALVDLNTRRFCIFDNNGGVFFTFSENIVNHLKKCNDTDTLAWNAECVYKIVYCLSEASLPEISKIRYREHACVIF